MRAANKELLEDEAHMGQANAILGKFGAKYKGTVSVRHLLWLLIDDIGLDALQKWSSNRSTGSRSHRSTAAISSGPSQSTAGNLRATRIRSKISSPRWAAKPVDYAGKTRCCGFHIQLEKEGVAANMVGQNMRMAKDNGAEAVLTPCPLCHLALDGYQADSAARWGRTDLPTFHLTAARRARARDRPVAAGMNKHIITPGLVLQSYDFAPAHVA
jgi:succinate dehydrogenase / fumarate reductase cytochrome b subunit